MSVKMTNAPIASDVQSRFAGKPVSRGDGAFQAVIVSLAGFPLLILVVLIGMLFLDARLSILRYGFKFLTDTTWDPVFENFGAGAFIFGTLVTSMIALILATPVAIGAGLFLVEYAPDWLREPVAFTIELLAAIPSIIYGLWGFFVLAPLMASTIEPFFQKMFGSVPLLGALFDGSPLAIMIIPTITAIAREIFRAVPDTQREGMLALGATKYEMIRNAILPYAQRGLIGASILGLARALGETMAVTLVIGNSSTKISASLFTPGYTLSSVIANQFTEADKDIYFSAIVELGLVLLLVATLLNLLARLLVARTSSK